MDKQNNILIGKFQLLVFLLIFYGVNAQKTWSDKDSVNYKHNLSKYEEYINKDLDSSIYYIVKLEIFLRSKEDKKSLVRILISKGNVYLLKGLHEKALQSYAEADKISEQMGYNLGRAYANISISGIYIETKEYEKVLEISMQIDEIFKVKDSTPNELTALAVIYNSKGIALENLNRFDEAERTYLTAKKISKKLDNPYYLANVLSNLASVKQKQKKYNGSLELHKKVLDIRKKNNYGIGVVQSYGNLAQIYLVTGDTLKAKDYYLKGLEKAQKMNSPKYIDMYASELAKLFAADGDYRQAFRMQQLELESKAELINQESLKREATLKANYENMLKNRELKDSRKRRETIFYFLTGILVLLFFIVTILYLLQKSKTAEGRLKNENIEKEKALLEQDLEYKNKKLVTNLMYQLQKNEMITSITEKLVALKVKSKPESKEPINEIIKELKMSMKTTLWDEFETYFQEVHTDFYKKLTEQYNLTPNELKIAAFVKLNLSSKEISSITGQSVRTLDVARYRLRKKLGISNTNVNLSTFLSKI